MRNEGTWTEESFERFRTFLQARGVHTSSEELLPLLHKARLEYLRGASRLYVCGAAPCAGAGGRDTSDSTLRALATDTGVPVSKTGCQGRCKQAPVIALRIGQRSQIFGRMIAQEDHLAIADFAKAAAQSGSFLVPSGAADEFRYDPEHRDHAPAGHLRSLRFLLGRFRGEGRFAESDYAFQKELVGAYEVGGRFITLRMEATYPLPEGGNDVHRALVVVGTEHHSGAITGRAYTDGGGIRDYAVERREFALHFEDESPDHERRWKRARKILRATDNGFEERLEVDAGDGYTPYYVVQMRRLSDAEC